MNYLVRVSEMDPGVVIEADEFTVDGRDNLYLHRDGRVVAAFKEWVGCQEVQGEDLS